VGTPTIRAKRGPDDKAPHAYHSISRPLPLKSVGAASSRLVAPYIPDYAHSASPLRGRKDHAIVVSTIAVGEHGARSA